MNPKPLFCFRRVLVTLTTLACLTSVGVAQNKSDKVDATGNIMRGWRVFHDKQCTTCHAVWDQGGYVGPDLGRIRTSRSSPGKLAGVMWNHIPKMLGQMKQTGRRPIMLTREEMGDLFALIFFVRQLDELGDSERGARVLQSKGCTECHSIGSAEEGIGPDLAKWGRFANPIAWAQMMWEHAPMMQLAMERSGIHWPKLEGSDLGHILAYVRSSSGAREREYLAPGSVQHGKVLFVEKHCNECHPGTGPDFSQPTQQRSVGALAAQMWNHSPAMMSVMRDRKVKQEPVSAQELADILSYVLALGNTDSGGDAGRGATFFQTKGCAQCHEATEVNASKAPPVADLKGDATPVDIAAAMWNHSDTMLEKMTEAGLSWPMFNDREMVDLLAFLQATKTEESNGH